MSTFSFYDSTVNSFYLAFYGRPADPAGLKFWSQQLASNNGDFGAITQAFATSAEAQTRFGSTEAAARITDIYQQLFNRAPDAAGLTYWTDVVESGKASLAEVSIAILKGAQGSDLDLSTVRQQAANAFTAAVEDGSTEYTGYASIEAARVLVRAVTADTTQADLANLVKAAVSFADTATKNPKVVEAIATGSTLLNLFDTARGTKDPVGLAQALADTAKAAAGDPVTLESLLRGGGMDKVLKVMPAKATLTDVVEALAKGGLPAAVEVVYPPKPAPSAPMTLKYESVSQGVFDTNKHDNVTNVEVATVKFSYTGSGLKAGQGFQYSTDGVNWTSKGVSADAATQIVTIKGVNLAGESLSQPNSAGITIQGELLPVANVFTKIQLRAADTAGNVIAKADSTIEYDGTPPSGFIQYVGGTGGGSCSLPESVDTFAKFAVLDHDVIQWHIEGDSDWIDVDQFADNGTFKLPGLDLNKADQKVEVRVIDAAGNSGPVLKHTFNETPKTTSFNSAELFLDGGPSKMILNTGEGPVTGMNWMGFNMSTFGKGYQGSVEPYYMFQTKVMDGVLQFPASLTMNLYQMTWGDSTFTTGSGTDVHTVNTGSLLFAGGMFGYFKHSGFVVDTMFDTQAGTVRDSSDHKNEAFAAVLGQNLIVTGGGHDVITSPTIGGSRGVMDIRTDTLDESASDLVFYFNSTDKFSFTGAAATAIDKNSNGTIQWSGRGETKITFAQGDEAARVIANGVIVAGDKADMAVTAATLQSALDVQAMTKGDSLLILATDGSNTSALFHYVEHDGNGRIDADDLSMVAMFAYGAPDTGNIQLIGTQELAD